MTIETEAKTETETDEARFDRVMERGEPQPVEAAAEEVVKTTEAPAEDKAGRDEKGRFSKKNETASTEEAAPVAAAEDRKGFVPSGRLKEESDARRSVEARMSQIEAENRLFRDILQRQQAPAEQVAPQEKVDPIDSLLADPDAYINSKLSAPQSEIAQMREFYSQRDAVREHGAEKVDEAYRALDAAIRSGAIDGDAALKQLKRSQDPFGEIMAWHKRNSIVTEVGSDPEAYRAKIRAELMAEMQEGGAPQGAQSGQPPANVVKIPPSLNRITAASSKEGGAELSDEARFDKAISRRR